MGMVTAYKCDSCGRVTGDPDDFLEVQGNIMVPGQGGLVGQNIFTDKEENNAESSRGDAVERTEGLRIYSSVFCLVCFARICKLSSVISSNRGE